MRKRSGRLDIVKKIISERQPIRLHKAWDFAKGYAAFKDGTRYDFYSFIGNHFNVDENNFITMLDEKEDSR